MRHPWHAALLFVMFVAGALVTAGAVVAATGENGYPQAGTVATGYQPDRQTAAFRAGLAVADVASGAVMLATTEFVLTGRPNVPVSARFSASGQTCKVRILQVYKSGTTNTILGITDELTLTGATVQDSGAKWVAPTVVFDGGGATHVRAVLTAAPSSGTVDLWVGSF